uniref:Uncharacterized protein n=1 Tax=Lutzomyia longipalpis TaxID=7200 RepID=A0A1B0GIC1_LUTLO
MEHLILDSSLQQTTAAKCTICAHFTLSPEIKIMVYKIVVFSRDLTVIVIENSTIASKKINTFVSNKIGYTYFNILGPQCFREEYPIISCAMSYRNRCYSYIVDDGNIKTWQWFDNKLY